MKKRGILFSAPMVRALLDGSKTQTRRIVKSRSANHPEFVLVAHDDINDVWWPYYSDDGESSVTDDGMEEPIECPYGAPGDQLWVRETWAQNWNQLSDTRMDRSYVYKADGETRAQDNGSDLPWRPCIHMPRAASRITLEITDVRVERLQNISTEDCIAEGMSTNLREYDAECSLRDQYRYLWESINGPGAWDANPWVWVISFKRVQP